jgi:hypothetical protein
MSQIPFLVISDAVTSPTGLGRIGRELCIRIHQDLSDVFRLGTLGYGGNTSRVFPWQQYVLSNPDNWKIPELPRTWLDFAGKQPGIILFILNASWLSSIIRLGPEEELERIRRGPRDGEIIEAKWGLTDHGGPSYDAMFAPELFGIDRK